MKIAPQLTKYQPCFIRYMIMIYYQTKTVSHFGGTNPPKQSFAGWGEMTLFVFNLDTCISHGCDWTQPNLPNIIGLLRGGPRGGVSLIFPKVPQSSLGILRVPQLPRPLGHPPLKNPIKIQWKTNCELFSHCILTTTSTFAWVCKCMYSVSNGSLLIHLILLYLLQIHV